MLLLLLLISFFLLVGTVVLRLFASACLHVFFSKSLPTVRNTLSGNGLTLTETSLKTGNTASRWFSFRFWLMQGGAELANGTSALLIKLAVIV